MPPAAAECGAFDLFQDAWSVRRAVHRLLGDCEETPSTSQVSAPPLQRGPDRRTSRRRCLRKAALLSPVLFDGTGIRLPEGENRPILVMTRDISPQGIGLTHDEPLPTRHGVISFGGFAASFLVEERWAAHRAGGQIGYRSGWRILGVVRSAKPA